MIKNIILGNKYLQTFFEFLYKCAIKGMNYDRGHVPLVNGEPYAVDYILKYFKDENCLRIFDIGANRGQYLTMLLSKRSQLEIHCFEPQKDAFTTLFKKYHDSQLVTLNNFALGNMTGEITLYKDCTQSEYASLYHAHYTQYNKTLDLKETVKIDTLDHYCSSNQIDFIHLLKIDTEGHELEVLKGAEDMIGQKKIKFIQFEFGLASIESRIFLKDFFQMLTDYDIFRILPNGLRKIQYNEYKELFLTTNYLAILK